jgi:hypothetical protein
MTREDLRRLAAWQPENAEPIQRTQGRDTYTIVEVFQDTSFLDEPQREKEK